jgi:hypothetical protein
VTTTGDHLIVTLEFDLTTNSQKLIFPAPQEYMAFNTWLLSLTPEQQDTYAFWRTMRAIMLGPDGSTALTLEVGGLCAVFPAEDSRYPWYLQPVETPEMEE